MPDYIAQSLRPAGQWSGASDACVMTYDERFLRRKVVQTMAGKSVLIDLPKVTSLNQGDALTIAEGAFIEIRAAAEPLLAVTAAELPRIAWHIGNRHTPCQIENARLLIQRDHVMADMLAKVGATVREVVEPFTPEGGAYGHGRTHGHDHTHAHGPAHEHAHDH